MIVCPNPSCNQKLPDFVQTCQFCGQDLTSVRRPHSDDPITGSGVKPEAVSTLYYVLSTLILLSGVWGVIDALVVGVGEYGMDLGNILSAVFSGAQVLVAIGLLAKVEIARGIVNIFCWIGIFLAGLSVVFLVVALLTPFGAILSPGYLLVAILISVVRIAIYGGMIWVIGETDRYGYR